MMKYALALIAGILFCACSQQEKKVPEEFPEKQIPEVTDNKANIMDSAGLQNFENIEQVQYCTGIPFKEYEEDFSKPAERAKHSFKSKLNQTGCIQVQGLFRTEASTDLKTYFTNTYASAEEEGMIIQSRGIDTLRNTFWIYGYMNNKIQEERFFELCYLRIDDLVLYKVNFPVSDSTLWKNRLEVLKQWNSRCN